MTRHCDIITGILAVIFFMTSGCSIRQTVDSDSDGHESKRTGGETLQRGMNDETATVAKADSRCGRIVSLAPSITQILTALSLGDRVVGITRYCDKPNEHAALIGGYTDPAYERILALQPDVVFLLNLHEKPREDFKTLQIETVMLQSQSIEEILRSILTVASHCGVEKHGQQIVDSMRTKMHGLKDVAANQKHPRVLLSVGRSMGTDTLQDIFVAGRQTWINELIEIAGGINVVKQMHVQYPMLSLEGVLQLNPDIIVELVPDSSQNQISESEIVEQWQIANAVSAVQQGRIYVLRQKNIAQPGPGVVTFAQQLSRIFYDTAPHSPQIAGMN